MLELKDLYVFDLANNHQGDVKHATKIINELGKISKDNNIKGVVKFQFRQLDTFIHKNHLDGSGSKHIPRFLSTRLEKEDFKILYNKIRENNLFAMCTPFDEESVDVIEDMGFDIIKVASCSAKDWPLLERISKAGLPTVASTGGLTLPEIDNLVSFFEHKGNPFALMHCVSIYPIPDDTFNLNLIEEFVERYPNISIGWSTHEDPSNNLPGQIAISKGAKLMERHVGLETESIKLNAYSSTPAQVDKWIKDCLYAKKLCGTKDTRKQYKEEQDSLDSLTRGVFVKRNINAGEILKKEDVYFAMPYKEGQLASGNWKENIKVIKKIEKDFLVENSNIEFPVDKKSKKLKKAIHNVKVQLNKAKISLHQDFKVEFSHHRGMENFDKIGAVIIDCINREYCKKLIIQTPGQSHPTHYHQKKEECFQLLAGDVTVIVDGKKKKLLLGEIILIQRGVWHSFLTENGCVIEEISTTHINNDSFYKDVKINSMKREDRKTVVENWGRFEI